MHIHHTRKEALPASVASENFIVRASILILRKEKIKNIKKGDAKKSFVDFFFSSTKTQHKDDSLSISRLNLLDVGSLLSSEESEETGCIEIVVSGNRATTLLGTGLYKFQSTFAWRELARKYIFISAVP